MEYEGPVLDGPIYEGTLLISKREIISVLVQTMNLDPTDRPLIATVVYRWNGRGWICLFN